MRARVDRRRAVQGQKPNIDKCNELGFEAASGGLAAADAGLATADQATKFLKSTRQVDVSEIKFVGGLTSFTGAAFTAKAAISNYQPGNYSALALNASDLTVSGVGVIFPEIALLVIIYGAGRTVWDVESSLAEAKHLGCH